MSAKPLLNAAALTERKEAKVVLLWSRAFTDLAAKHLPRNAVVGFEGESIDGYDLAGLKGRQVTLWIYKETAVIRAVAAACVAAGATDIKWVDTRPGKAPFITDLCGVVADDKLAGELRPFVVPVPPAEPPKPAGAKSRPSLGVVDGGAVRKPREKPKPAPDPADAAEISPKYSHDQIAKTFVQTHGEQMRYCAPYKAWLLWDRGRWSQDGSLLAEHRAREVCRGMAEVALVDDELPNDKARNATATTLTSLSTVRAVEQMARTDRRIAASPDMFDRDPWLMNTPKGTVDLTTGELHPHKLTDYCTKQAAVTPDLDTEPAIWLDFLRFAADGDEDMVEFLQRWSGYCMTGDTTEQQFLFAYGPGGNGKGTFINTITAILGDYAAVSPMDLFTLSRFGNDAAKGYALAELKGARIVAAQETGDGSRWDEAMLKSLTGGEAITARKPYERPVTYTPQFKLFIVGNHLPSLSGVDEAIRRRINLVPFIRKPETPDLQLAAKLREEWPAILGWMIRGAMAWRDGGLRRPQAVTAATTEYLNEEDLFGTFLRDCCVVGAGYTVTARALYAAYKDFMLDEGRDRSAWSKKRVGQNLKGKMLPNGRGEDVPIMALKTAGQAYYRNLGLRSDRDEADQRGQRGDWQD